MNISIDKGKLIDAYTAAMAAAEAALNRHDWAAYDKLGLRIKELELKLFGSAS